MSRISFPIFFQSFYFSPCPQPMVHSYRGWSPAICNACSTQLQKITICDSQIFGSGWKKVCFTTDLGTMLSANIFEGQWFGSKLRHVPRIMPLKNQETLVGITPAFGYLFGQCSVTVRQGVKDLAKKNEGHKTWQSSTKMSNKSPTEGCDSLWRANQRSIKRIWRGIRFCQK